MDTDTTAGPWEVVAAYKTGDVEETRTWGPFVHRENAERTLPGLAARPDVIAAEIREVAP